MEIVLIGFMGSGKTTISQLLGKILAKPVVDLDQAIVKQAGSEITEIFNRHGEQYFRQLEHDSLKRIITESGILATGGGTPLRADNAEILATSGAKVVLLEASGETILERLKTDCSRPLAKQMAKQQLLALNQARQSHYQQCADLTIQTDKLTPKEVVAKILASLETVV